ncbi:MAG: hypothetical protein ACI855_002799 [Myxococcota bacterium]|jgi:hypothetical protein
MMWMWLTWAVAAPTVCDPAQAAQLLEDARIDERRAPVTHPELMPGLALASDTSDTRLREVLTGLCSNSESVSVAPAESWEDAAFSAYSYRVTGSQTVGCALFQSTVTVSVGVQPDRPPTYALRSESPVTSIPIGACETPATWREESVIDGDEDRVRLVLVIDRTRSGVQDSQVVIRTATDHGWTEDLLLSPAPERYVGGVSGPILTLAETGDGDAWVVAHANRVVREESCLVVPGQMVWQWDGSGWIPTDGREALALLGRRGLWRLAGSDGWLHIVVQDREGDDEVLAYRATRLAQRYPEALRLYQSSDLPGLNAGFLVMAPAPFPTEEQAKVVRKSWRSMHRHYVKRAWTQPNPCDSYTTVVVPE